MLRVRHALSKTRFGLLALSIVQAHDSSKEREHLLKDVAHGAHDWRRKLRGGNRRQ